MNTLPDYTVTMSVYSGEVPEFFRKSLQSIYEQTHPCHELILVCDGELTAELDKVIEEFKAKFGRRLRILRSSRPVGVGACANAAIKAARTDYIVKMDSDDIALPQRCERQLRFMTHDSQVEICGAYIEEFDSDTGESISIKSTPVTHEEILRYACRRNPFNNPTLVFKRKTALDAGGYSGLERCEDYEFVVRMLMAGAIGANLPEVLVKYRVTGDNLSRRRNFRNTKGFITARWRIHRSGFSSLADFLIPCAAQVALFLLPGKLTGNLYNRFLRDKT